MADAKEALRGGMRARRRGVGKAERAAAGAAVCEAVLGLAAVRRVVERGGSVFGYVDVGGEVPTRGLLGALLGRGVTVAVPRVVRGGGAGGPGLEAVVVRSLDGLERGRYGVPEPAGVDEAGVIEHTPDVTLVPGLAFTADGRRLGQGGGYYDAYLAAHPGTFAVGLCYAWQVMADLPTDSHDRRVGCVVTEAGVIRPG